MVRIEGSEPSFDKAVVQRNGQCREDSQHTCRLESFDNFGERMVVRYRCVQKAGQRDSATLALDSLGIYTGLGRMMFADPALFRALFNPEC